MVLHTLGSSYSYLVLLQRSPSSINHLEYQLSSSPKYYLMRIIFSLLLMIYFSVSLFLLLSLPQLYSNMLQYIDDMPRSLSRYNPKCLTGGSFKFKYLSISYLNTLLYIAGSTCGIARHFWVVYNAVTWLTPAKKFLSQRYFQSTEKLSHTFPQKTNFCVHLKKLITQTT